MMSEEEREMEEVLRHWMHEEHPLTLVYTSVRGYCFACFRDFRSGEQRYACTQKSCGSGYVLHRECAEMAMKIRHPMHPQHTLIQNRGRPTFLECDVCKRYLTIYAYNYHCTSPECSFVIHIGCGQDMGVMDSDEQGRTRIKRHKSHPRHELRLLSRPCSFKCDACGTTHRGSSYVCSLCDFWINERCASLEVTMKREDHPHSLSLSFGVPHEYIIDQLKCDVCNKELVPRYWVYHCRLFRYVVHLMCAFKKMPDYTKINYGEDIIQIPMAINDVAEKLIRPFITRQGGSIPPIPNPNEDAKYEFHSHEHQLTLISSSSNEEEEEKDSSDDEEDYGTTSELICDGCITPIPILNKNKCCYYMSCSECKYFLHYECFHLPPRLSSLQFHAVHRDLVLQSCAKLRFYIRCDVCSLYSNGLFYTREGGYFNVDIKCASLPDTIYHAAHPQHLLKFKQSHHGNKCASGYDQNTLYGYVCDDCEFNIGMEYILLPTSTQNHEWDKKHPLMLTLDARPNHPDEFYCDECETKMHPKMWMYECRTCDLSFHPTCFPAASGEYRNIKFGQKYVIEAHHPHPLTYQLLTTKRSCDICRFNKYHDRGFHCASCNFFICLRGSCHIYKFSCWPTLSGG